MANVPMKKWGKDHWSLLAYIDSCCINNNGKLNSLRMRADGEKYPTRTKDGELRGHNDYHCLKDLESEGFVQNIGTLANPIVRMSDKGLDAMKQLTKHKQTGGNYDNFVFGL